MKKRILIYGKKTYTNLLENILTKTQLRNDTFRDLVRKITKVSPIKIFILDSALVRNKFMAGRSNSGNTVYLFPENIMTTNGVWWKELLYFTAIHEIVHLLQNTNDYKKEYSYTKMYDYIIEKEADGLARQIALDMNILLVKKTTLRPRNFFNYYDPIAKPSEYKRVQFSINNYEKHILEEVCNELDIDFEVHSKFNICIKDLRIEIFNKNKDRLNTKGIEFFLAYTNLFRLKNKRDYMMRMKKNIIEYEYDPKVFRQLKVLLD